MCALAVFGTDLTKDSSVGPPELVSRIHGLLPQLLEQLGRGTLAGAVHEVEDCHTVSILPFVDAWAGVHGPLTLLDAILIRFAVRLFLVLDTLGTLVVMMLRWRALWRLHALCTHGSQFVIIFVAN